LGLPVNEPGEDLLGVAEHERVSEDLLLRVQCGQAWHELAAQQQQPSGGG
jgi:hypothetical protein